MIFDLPPKEAAKSGLFLPSAAIADLNVCLPQCIGIIDFAVPIGVEYSPVKQELPLSNFRAINQPVPPASQGISEGIKVLKKITPL